MTNQEAIKMFRAGLKTAECKQKRELYITALMVLEKQIPAKPIEDGYHRIEKVCPVCGEDLTLCYKFPLYCPNCGQALTEEKRGEQYDNQQ